MLLSLRIGLPEPWPHIYLRSYHHSNIALFRPADSRHAMRGPKCRWLWQADLRVLAAFRRRRWRARCHCRALDSIVSCEPFLPCRAENPVELPIGSRYEGKRTGLFIYCGILETGTRHGIRISTTRPPPGRLAAVSCPACSRMARSAIASPTPEPPVARCLA